MKSPQSNGIAEAFVTLQRNHVHVTPLPDAATIFGSIAGGIEDYNDNHPHSGLKMRSQREFIEAQTATVRVSAQAGQDHAPTSPSDEILHPRLQSSNVLSTGGPVSLVFRGSSAVSRVTHAPRRQGRPERRAQALKLLEGPARRNGRQYGQSRPQNFHPRPSASEPCRRNRPTGCQ